MKRKWIAAVSVCLCLVDVGMLYTKGPEESPAPASPEAKQTEQPEKGGMGHSPSGFPPESEFGRALAGECGDLLRR